jgi:hypothetical protein
MDKISSKDSILPIPRGNVRIRSFCRPAEIRKCTFDREFAFHTHYKSLYTSRELLENPLSNPTPTLFWLWSNTTTSLDTVCRLTPIRGSGGSSWDREL